MREVLDAHWTSAGYAAPNAVTYPWQWLWDSCFHAVVWHALGRPGRAVAELTTALSTQTDDGFVPHMNYVDEPEASVAFWGRRGASSITQPPMFGHGVAVLVESGVDVPAALIDRAVAGLEFLVRHRRRHRSGLVPLCHPWESGADDSPRWDDTCPGGWRLDRWRAHKGALVESVVRGTGGGAIDNPAFDVASVGFNALVAWNIERLASVGAAPPSLVAAGSELVDALSRRWDPTVSTWVDAGMTEAGSGRVRTADALLAVLVDPDPERVDAVERQLADPSAFGGPFGPAGVHRGEPTFRADGYWRGPVWPQLAYLLWLGLRRHGRTDAAARLARETVAGATASGLAEYWHPDDGGGLGAIPQSWTGVAIVMVDDG